MSDQFWASLFGSFFGFLFALILFFITGWIKRFNFEKKLKESLLKDFKLNLRYMDEWIERVNRIIADVGVENRRTYGYLKYTDFLIYFLQKAYQEGVVYKIFNHEELIQITRILLQYSIGGEQLINGYIKGWQDGVVDQQSVTSQLNIEKDNLYKHKRIIQGFISKLEK